MSKAILILTSVSNDTEAENIANELVNKNIAACVNIIPNIRSIYKWQGNINFDSEVLLFIKTMDTKEKHVKDAINKLHSYDTPEILSFKINGGDDKYLSWLNESIANEL